MSLSSSSSSWWCSLVAVLSGGLLQDIGAGSGMASLGSVDAEAGFGFDSVRSELFSFVSTLGRGWIGKAAASLS